MKDKNDPGTLDILSNLTPIQHRRIKASSEIAMNPAKDITFQHTVLCQTALPYRNPGDEVRKWQRKQGAVSLRIDAGAAHDPRSGDFIEVGLPYGSRPRMILAHLNREALLQASPVIEVEDSLTAFVRRVQNGHQPTSHYPRGHQIRSFKEQLARLSAATIRLAYSVSEDHSYQIDTKFITAFEFWSKTENGQRVLWPSEVRLSQDYFDSLTRHAVPLDERAIGALANSAVALDVYCWLVQRLHRIPKHQPQRITWQALYDQFGHGYTRLRAFRADFLKVLALVHTQYRAAKVEADQEGLELRNSVPPVAARLATIPKLMG